MKFSLIHRDVRAVSKSLRNNPSEWSGRSSFHLTHESGVAVWRANRPYGLEIKVHGIRTWGGVSFLSAFGLSISHWALLVAIKRWELGSGGDVEALLSGERIA